MLTWRSWYMVQRCKRKQSFELKKNWQKYPSTDHWYGLFLFDPYLVIFGASLTPMIFPIQKIYQRYIRFLNFAVSSGSHGLETLGFSHPTAFGAYLYISCAHHRRTDGPMRWVDRCWNWKLGRVDMSYSPTKTPVKNDDLKLENRKLTLTTNQCLGEMARHITTWFRVWNIYAQIFDVPVTYLYCSRCKNKKSLAMSWL